MRAKKVLVIHPFLLSLFPVLALVSDHLDLKFVPRVVVRIAGGMLAVASFAFVVTHRVVRDAQKAGAILSTALLLFSSYGYVFDAVSARNKNIKHRHLIAVWGALEIFFTRLILKTSGSVKPLTDFLNIVSGSLIAMSSTQIIAHYISREFLRRQPAVSLHPPGAEPPAAAAAGRVFSSSSGALSPARDIYYLIVDGHASASTLRDMYSVDIAGFSAHLEEHGFFIAEKSRSNYAMTMLSLASSLNGDYLHTIGPDLVDTDRKHLRETQRLIEDNFTTRFLKTRGYRFVFIGSGFGITQKNLHADLDIRCGFVDEFSGRFIQSTLIRPIADRIRLIENDRRKRILRMFVELDRVSRLAGPKFVFAHVPAPQWPFLFDANGDPVQPKIFEPERRKKAYTDQLAFIDRKVTQLVDSILAEAEVEPIIVIQSDHGPNFIYDQDDYFERSPGPDLIREKMGILNAYLLPGSGETDLYPSISPVNTFRVIFNRYFSADLPLLDDRAFYSTFQFPYLMTDIASLNHRHEESVFA